MSDHRPGRPRRPARPVPPHAEPDVAARRQPPTHEKRPPWLAPRRLADWPVTSCGCDDCKEACLNSPGWFLPDEVERVADYLNLTLEALFRKYLAVSVVELPDGTKRYGVMPHKLRDHKKPGDVWALGEVAEPGRCIFYDHGKCGIYPVRPFECARTFHSHRKELKALRLQVVERWTREALRVFEAWVGRRLFPKHQPAGPVEGRAAPSHGRPRGGNQPGNRRGEQGREAPGNQARRPADAPRGGRGRGGQPRGGEPPDRTRGRRGRIRPDHEGAPEAHPDFAEERPGHGSRGGDDDGFATGSRGPRPRGDDFARGPRPPRPAGAPGGGGGRKGWRPRRGGGPGRPPGAGDD